MKFRISSGAVYSFPSGRKLTAEKMCEGVFDSLHGHSFDSVTIGYPGPVDEKGPISNPELLGADWVGYDFNTAFGNKPVRMINDAAMQAIGCYVVGRRMLFLGLGTGLGTCLISNHVVIPLEIANLPYREKKSYGDYLAQRGFDEYGEEQWLEALKDVTERFMSAFVVQDFVYGGGNARLLTRLPPNTRKVDGSIAFEGGNLLWAKDCPFVFG